MKKAGLIILAVGLMITIFTGFNFVTKEKIVDMGKFEVTRDTKHDSLGSPLAGLVVMLVGGVVFLSGARKP